jgi:peroxiredoxin
MGASLIAISPQTADSSLVMAEKNALGFEVLSDSGNQVAREFGLTFVLAEKVRTIYKNAGGIDLIAYNGDESWELPITATFVIGRDATIRLAFVDADYTRRLEPSEILSCLRDMPRH